MPHPIDYNGGQDDDRIRSIDVVHIEPSIREGLHLVSSLYGKEASAPIRRFSPVNTNPPRITGDTQIPNNLTCQTGQWTGSPTPLFDFQWMANGVDIPGATEQTWMSTLDYDGQDITCEVRGYNYQGQAYAITDPVRITLLEPVEVMEYEGFVISGLNSGTTELFNADERTVITSGVSALDRMDVVRSVAYFSTGTSGPTRNDVNAMNVSFIQALGGDQMMEVIDAGTIGVVTYTDAQPLVESVPQLMGIKNNGAELGTLGWDFQNAIWYTDSVSANEGVMCFWGGEDVDAGQLNIPYSYIWQDVPIESVWEADVDAGTCFLNLWWAQLSLSGSDMANMRCEFFDVNMISLGVNGGPGLWGSPSGVWFGREFEVAIPPNTRFVRVVAEFNLILGENINAYIDSIRPYIRKGVKIVSRDFGPAFEKWRLRFVLSNTWPGVALSEIEFRNGIGGADLATGGSPIFGSAGLGVANADFAFDDLRSTGYWAGSENAVAEGTSWVGYDMGTPVKPREIDITARLGDSEALQMGREFYLEGSDDGLNWTPVQRYLDVQIGTFTSGQQKQFEVWDGPFDYWTTYAGGSYLYDRDNFGSDDHRQKGNVYLSTARQNITHVRALTYSPGVDNNWQFQIAVVKIDPRKSNNNYAVGFISEVHEVVTLDNLAVDSNYIWSGEVALSTPMELEVGEYWAIIAMDTLGNPNEPDGVEARIPWIDSWNGLPSAYTGRPLNQFIDSWLTQDTDFVIGNSNNSGINVHLYWAVDYRGEVF